MNSTKKYQMYDLQLRDLRCGSVLKCSPSTHEVLGSIPVTFYE